MSDADLDDLRAHPHHAAVARAIEFMVRNREEGGSLDAVAGVAKMHPHHFQRVFKRHAGVSPKRFVQALTLDHARRLLASGSVLSAAVGAGLSGTSRLHDLFVACEAVTPGEFRRRGEGLVIRWGVHESVLGECLLATTPRGVCWLGFGEGDALVREFEGDWAAATRVKDPDATRSVASRLFGGDGGREVIRLDLHGTNFQLQVWRALLRIPEGHTATYAQVAAAIGRPSASRAVGAAVGANPVSLLIPCHRVILATGVAHNYRWGVERKRALLAIEAARDYDPGP